MLEFKDAPVGEKTDQKTEGQNPERRQDRASKRTLRKSLRKQFLKKSTGNSSVESLSPFVRLAQPVEPKEAFGCGGWI